MIFVSLPQRFKIPNLVKIGHVVFEKKMLTRRTTHDDGRQPIAIGQLSDAGELDIDRIYAAIIRLFLFFFLTINWLIHMTTESLAIIYNLLKKW